MLLGTTETCMSADETAWPAPAEVSPDFRAEGKTQNAAACFHCTQAFALIEMAAGLLVLAGWLFNLDLLRNVPPGIASIMPGSGAGFLAFGLGLWAASRPGAVMSRIAAGAAVAIISGATLG